MALNFQLLVSNNNEFIFAVLPHVPPYLEMSLFPSIIIIIIIICTISAFSLYGDYFVRSFLPDGVFSTL